MSFKKKLTGLLVAALCLLPSFGQALTINGNLDVRGNIVGGVRRIGETNNLTLSLASGILKIQCGNADCSTSNPGWITLPSNTAGQMVTYKITSSPQFGDATAGDSDFVGTGTCSWGTTAAVAWGNDMPILLGAFHDGTTVVFGMARGPVLTTGASTNIGYQDNCPSSADQKNVIAMTSTNVTSTHANKAFFLIGAVRATKNASDNYTFSALDNGDGVQIFYNFTGRKFSMPTGQNGANSTKYFSVSGGTAPTYTLFSVLDYYLDLNGRVTCDARFGNTSGGTAGAGTSDNVLAAPYKSQAGMNYFGEGFFDNTGLSTIGQFQIAAGTTNIRGLYQSTIGTATTFISGNLQNGATRGFSGFISYQADF